MTIVGTSGALMGKLMTHGVPVLAWKERLDLLVNALAQLPDDVTLQVDSNHPERANVELLAGSYGIGDRVGFVEPKEQGPLGVVVRSEAPDSSVRVPGSGGEFRSMAELVESLSRLDDPQSTTQRDVKGLLEGHRVAVVTNLPTHYRVPLFNTLSERCRSAGARLQVLFLARPPTTRPWMKPGEISFDHAYLRGIDLSRDRGRHVVPLDLEAALTAFAPTILVVASFSPAVASRAVLYARRRGIPCGVWSGEIPSGATAQGWLRTRQRRWLVQRVDFAAAYGSESARYLRSLREDLPLVLVRNTALVPPQRSRPARPETIEVLTVARAEQGKALSTVVAALRRTRDLPCRLTVVGEGPELPHLREQARDDQRIRFVGALPSDQILRTFSDSDVFLFPSTYDSFGLALVEAMGGGLATIVSSRPGAVADLCVSDVNSLIVAENVVDEWASALSRVAKNHDLRLRLGEAAARSVRNRWTIDHAADAMLAGVRLGLLVRGNGKKQ